MNCEDCHQQPAVTTVTQNIDGIVRERNLCAACARHTAQKMSSLIDVLFGVEIETPAGGKAIRPEPECDICGMGRGAFKKNHRLGCAECYSVFAHDIAPIIKEMQHGERHVGKIPARERANADRITLESALKRAVREQRFEEAAVLRDRLRDLVPEGAAKGGGDK